MEWLAVALAVAVAAQLLWLFVLRNGNDEFWEAVNRNPNAAASFFRQDPQWYIDQRPPGSDIVGPFPFFDPVLGRKVDLFARYSGLEASQAAFLRQVGGAPARRRGASVGR